MKKNNNISLNFKPLLGAVQSHLLRRWIFTVFPNGSVWSNYNLEGTDDLVLFGKVEETHIDIDKLEERLNAKDYDLVRKSLAEVNFFNLEDLLLTYTGRAKDMQDWMADAQLNTDRDLRLGYLAGIAYNLQEGQLIGRNILEYYKFPYEMITGSDEKIRSLEKGLKDNLMIFSR
ncbi:MAG: hypothetical protein JXA61_02215, partial [Bacteroidales bacterium]|nr:hypothetical protein [Bacteroidales bacterium]